MVVCYVIYPHIVRLSHELWLIDCVPWYRVPRDSTRTNSVYLKRLYGMYTTASTIKKPGI